MVSELKGDKHILKTVAYINRNHHQNVWDEA